MTKINDAVEMKQYVTWTFHVSTQFKHSENSTENFLMIGVHW